jgi:Leucine Rich Repeat
MVCADDTSAVIQRFVLALIYFEMNGDEWINCRAASSATPGECTNGTQWLDASHECEWYGITCDAASTVVSKIALKENNLTGTLPVELFSLVDLVGLSLDHNMIGGRIPKEIAALSKLTYLELDDNMMFGRIPPALYTMTSLKALDLNKNDLLGSLSNDIGKLTNLMVLQVEDNYLSGPIPSKGLAMLDEMGKFGWSSCPFSRRGLRSF